MISSRKRPILYLLLALICAFAAFYAFFAQGLDHMIALGVVVLGLTGFGLFFNKGYDLWKGDRGRIGAGSS